MSYSKKQITKAGETLRQLAAGGPALLLDSEAQAVVYWWVNSHSDAIDPIKKAVAMVQPVLGDAFLNDTYRLKEIRRIADKLRREPGMELPRMHDIIGARVVLRTRENVYRASELLNKLLNIKKVYDYVSAPKPSGYRAIHLTACIPTLLGDRIAEIQLRTQLQQEWAAAVETEEYRLGQPLKASQGDQELLQYFVQLGQEYADREPE